MKRRSLYFLVSTAISVGVIGLVVRNVNLGDPLQSLKDLQLWYLALAMVMIVCRTAVHTLRTQLLLPDNAADFPGIFQITCLHSSLTYLVPMGLGEFSLVLLLKKYYKVVLLEGFLVLLVARCADFLVLSQAILLVVLTSSQRISGFLVLAIVGITSVILISFIFLLRIIQTERMQRFIVEIEKGNASIFLDRLGEGVSRLARALAFVHERRIYGRLFIYSAFLWGFIYFFLYFVIQAVGERISLWNAVILSAINVPLMLLPIKGFGNLGNHEIGWVTALMVFGFSKESALTTAVKTHTVVLVMILILGAWGLCALALDSRKGKRAPL